ncbi:TAXI family TRAP transporter solute-binding subunit [Bacillus solimangrovi]|uniref:TRAP transporter n=1 Tax=Bacillus solimangrovi TaxID=1305675 RepID=A0A1E5LCI2_9BACI|nr:TAXI family TRAP transporter solute-binding subunit [Bacillus solimangrovi]OEH91786.1 TRAP transporter [Bacillus solimangrovi]
MKKNWLLSLVLMLAMSIVLVACGGGANEEPASEGEGTTEQTEAPAEGNFVTDLQLGTGSTGGTYFPLGQEIATVLNNNVGTEGFNVSAVSTGASNDNLARIMRDELQLGMAVHIPVQNAVEGKGEFEGVPVDNVGFIGHIYPEVMQVVTLGSTGIETIDQLKGKKVAIGPPGSGTQAAAKQILEAYGLNDGDYTAFEEGFGDAKNKLQDGQVDATFGFLGLPASSIDELQAQTKDVKFLPIEGDALATIEGNTGYEAFVIPADSFEWLNAPVNTITAYAVLVGSTSQISEELGYEITKALFENAGSISHTQGAHITKENALKGSNGLPLHPGAKKYFEEAGIE